jgi:flagellar biosynthesis/type III secretory pathway protein FliH
VRPWSPDDLFAEASSAVALLEPGGTAAGQPEDERGLCFVEDFPADGLGGFLHRLDAQERETLFKLVETEVRGEVVRQLRLDNEQWRQGIDETIRNLGAAMQARVADELHDVARHAVELSIAMAEQILRRAVELDRSVLLKAVETIVFRAERGTSFTLIANPADVTALQDHAETLRDLNIVSVNPDRRIERGGCVINAGGREWDYTLGGRFERLAEVVRESMLETPEETPGGGT